MNVYLFIDLRINETLQIGAVGNRTYRGTQVFIFFRVHHISFTIIILVCEGVSIEKVRLGGIPGNLLDMLPVSR